MNSSQNAAHNSIDNLSIMSDTFTWTNDKALKSEHNQERVVISILYRTREKLCFRFSQMLKIGKTGINASFVFPNITFFVLCVLIHLILDVSELR